MKKQSSAFLILLLSLTILGAMLCLTACYEQKKNENRTKKETTVVVNEVAHSLFYAPLYVAVEKGYLEEEGIHLELVTGFGADKTMTALLSNNADIGFMGPETTIYTYNEGAKDYAVNFAQLTQRAGNFLVSREPQENFSWKQLKGKKVLGGRKGGMPEMIFEYILRKNGLDPKKDLSIDQSIDFGSTAAAFSNGLGEYTVEFEPGATSLEVAENGYIVASLGVDSGYVPYTAFSARNSYLKEHPDTIRAFCRALKKAAEYCDTHTTKEIQKIIAPQFPDTKAEIMNIILKRYAEQKTWCSDLYFKEEGYQLLLDILSESGELSKRPKYEKLVTTEYVKE